MVWMSYLSIMCLSLFICRMECDYYDPSVFSSWNETSVRLDWQHTLKSTLYGFKSKLDKDCRGSGFSNLPSAPRNPPVPKAVYPGPQLKSFRGNAVSLSEWERGASV